ncbi:MAG: Hsp70 family protein [Sandaracinus sp.]|nr:Hsp70 family protein [Sandaracinus sp.]
MPACVSVGRPVPAWSTSSSPRRGARFGSSRTATCLRRERGARSSFRTSTGVSSRRAPCSSRSYKAPTPARRSSTARRSSRARSRSRSRSTICRCRSRRRPSPSKRRNRRCRTADAGPADPGSVDAFGHRRAGAHASQPGGRAACSARRDAHPRQGRLRELTIGIDLGTSNTCASIVEDGRARVIPTGRALHRAFRARDRGRSSARRSARRQAARAQPTETIYGSKRLVGRAYAEELADEFQPYFAFPLVETPDHQFGARLPDRIVSFEEVSERLLREVREYAVEHLTGPVDRAVVTVPAYFGETQREAVRRAARKAGLAVPRVVAEPTAAAVAYGYGRKEKATLVVFDLGGGTFDVSILKLDGSRFEVIATGGDAFLGGIDVDDLLANHLVESFKRTERLESFEPDATQIARLREAAEQCKKGLSVQKKFSVSLPHFAMVEGGARTLTANLTQEELFELTRGFCERLVTITRDTLEKAKLQTYAVDDVLLVGGSTRLPQVQEAVEKIFGRPPSKRINPDEAVAVGAALLAQETATAVELIDVLPLSIGFAGEGRRYMRLIPRNTSVPNKRSFVVRTTGENQLTYRMPLFQGERKDAAANEYLGTLVVEGIPVGPKGRQIELSLGLDEQCFLVVSAVDVESGKALDVKISRASSVADVIASLGDYEGPVEAPERPRAASPLGWFFSRLRGLFGKR